MKNKPVLLFSTLALLPCLLIGCGKTDENLSSSPLSQNQQASAETDITQNYESSETVDLVETATETEVVEQLQGSYSLEDAQSLGGMYVLYPDGSLDRYRSGYVMTWDTQPMTYGADSFPKDLVISTSVIKQNKTLLNNGQLVIFWPYENRVQVGLFAIEESGYSLFRYNDEDNLEGLIYTRGNATGTSLVEWNQGQTFYWSNMISYSTINGIPKDKFNEFPSTEGRDFGSFPPHQTYTIGVIEGTTLKEKEYTTDYMYCLHADTKSPFSLTPTTDEYAIFDFSDTPSGEYVFTVSRWDPNRSARRVISTYIEID